MTLATLTNKSGPHDTNGSTTNFPYTFRVDAEDELVVYQYDTTALTYDTLTLNSDYTVTGVGNDGGGDVVISPALASGYTITILRLVDIEQPFNAPQSGAWSPADYEDALDRITMMIQQHDEILARCVKDAAYIDPNTTDPATYLAQMQAAYIAATNLIPNSIQTSFIQDDAVDKDKIDTTDIAGDGLEDDGTGALRVDLDGATIARSASGIKVADGGIDTTQIADLAVTAAKLDINVVGGGLTKTGDALTVVWATQAQQEAGVWTGGAVTPAVQQFHPSAAKAWANVKGDATGAFGDYVKASYNIGGFTDNGVGDYSFTFTNNLSTGNFASAVNVEPANNLVMGIIQIQNMATSGFDVQCFRTHNSSSVVIDPATALDPDRFSFVIFGDL